jgi:hypothetical protein
MGKIERLNLLADLEDKPSYGDASFLEDEIIALGKAFPLVDIKGFLNSESIIGNGDTLYTLLFRLGHIFQVEYTGPEGEYLALEAITDSANQALQKILKTI